MQKLKNNEPWSKFTGSYKKKAYIRLHASNFDIRFLVTLKFSVHNFLETRVLKIFVIELPNKCSHFQPFCLPAKMVSETVIRPTCIFMATDLTGSGCQYTCMCLALQHIHLHSTQQQVVLPPSFINLFTQHLQQLRQLYVTIFIFFQQVLVPL